jgi:hypothetical protein
MTDDRDWSWLGPRDATTSPADPPADQFLWALEKRDHRVECRVRATPGGAELRVVLDGELWWSRLFRGAPLSDLENAAEVKRIDFTLKGWTRPGPMAP